MEVVEVFLAADLASLVWLATMSRANLTCVRQVILR